MQFKVTYKSRAVVSWS